MLIMPLWHSWKPQLCIMLIMSITLWYLSELPKLGQWRLGTCCYKQQLPRYIVGSFGAN
jgi:hypothetical protein